MTLSRGCCPHDLTAVLPPKKGVYLHLVVVINLSWFVFPSPLSSCLLTVMAVFLAHDMCVPFVLQIMVS